MTAHCVSLNVMRIKATSHLATLNHSAADWGILKRQQALVIAQGQENSVRKDLSFIEKANFAAQMQQGGYDRKVICDALSIDKTVTSATKARLLRSIPGIGPVSAAMLVAQMPELGRMTAGEAAAMAGLAPVPHDSGVMHGRRAIAGGRRAVRQVLYQAALAAACHTPVLKPLAKRLKGSGKPYKVVIIAIARRLITIANAILKTGETWRPQPG